jgi:Cu/Ag efflux protein CusF
MKGTGARMEKKMNPMLQRRFAMLGVVLGLLSVSLVSLNAQKKSYMFRGKVEQVDLKTKRITVTNEKIDGWMDSMSMGYAVENEDVLKSIKPGDQITAKVYDGDYVLHEVKVVSSGGEKKK